MKDTILKKAIVLTTLILFVGATIVQNALSDSVCSTGDTLSVSLQFARPDLTQINNITHVFLSDCDSFGEPGEPVLPFRTVKLLIPQMKRFVGIDVEVSAQPDIIDEVTDIALGREPVKTGDEPAENAPDASYDTNSLYPGELFTYVCTQQIRGYSIVVIHIHPIQYLGDTDELYYYSTIHLSIQLEDAPLHSLYRGLKQDEWYVRSLVDNPGMFATYDSSLGSLNSYEGGLCDTSEHVDYVIITGEALQDTAGEYTWQDLCNSKEERGLSTRIVTVEEIVACPDYWDTTVYGEFGQVCNDSASLLREFIKDAYLNWQTEFVLLGGDWDDTDPEHAPRYVPGGDQIVPARLMFYTGETEIVGYKKIPIGNGLFFWQPIYKHFNVPADYYFNHLDGDFNTNKDDLWGKRDDDAIPDIGDVDLGSELFIGRAPVDTEEQLSNFVKKTLWYQEYWDVDFLKQACFYGGNLGWSVDSAEYMEEIRNGTSNYAPPYTHGFVDWNTNHPNVEFDISNRFYHAWDSSGFHRKFIEAINDNDAAMITSLNHGWYTKGMGMSTSSLYALTNSKVWFATLQDCRSGGFHAVDDCWSTVAVCANGNHQAFAIISNTGYGWGHCTRTDGSSQYLQRFFYDALFNDDNPRLLWHLGLAHAYSKDMMAPYVDFHGLYKQDFRGVTYHNTLFGDPELSLKPPITLEDYLQQFGD